MNIHVEARRLTAHKQDASSVDYVCNMNLKDRFDFKYCRSVQDVVIMMVVGDEDVVDKNKIKKTWWIKSGNGVERMKLVTT